MDVFFTLGGLETACGVMTKLIEPDITVFMIERPRRLVMHADNQPVLFAMRRALWSCSDLGVEIWPCFQHVRAKLPLVVIFCTSLLSRTFVTI